MSIKKEIIIWIVLISSMVLSIFSIFNQSLKSTFVDTKVAYVDLSVVFEKFDMKSEIQLNLEDDLTSKKSTLDSLMFQLQTLNNQLKSEKAPDESSILKFEQLREQYINQKETFTKYKEDQTRKYDDQVLSQLTQYIKDYGSNRKYDLLLGATGDGTILYGAEKIDVTDDVISFINLSYQGKK